MIRVDQAGEYGATRIYAGQLAVLGDRIPPARAIARMAQQEERHRAFFDAMIARRGVRPTAAPAVLERRRLRAGRGDRGDRPRSGDGLHRRGRDRDRQALCRTSSSELGDSDPELSAAIADFQAEELEHREHGAGGGRGAGAGYPVLSGAIRLGCRVAIATAKRI